MKTKPVSDKPAEPIADVQGEGLKIEARAKATTAELTTYAGELSAGIDQFEAITKADAALEARDEALRIRMYELFEAGDDKGATAIRDERLGITKQRAGLLDKVQALADKIPAWSERYTKLHADIMDLRPQTESLFTAARLLNESTAGLLCRMGGVNADLMRIQNQTEIALRAKGAADATL